MHTPYMSYQIGLKLCQCEDGRFSTFESSLGWHKHLVEGDRQPHGMQVHEGRRHKEQAI